MALVEVVGVSRYNEEGHILKDIRFTQQKFQKIAIVGETGSGKSTLLKIIAGLIQPTEGEVLFEGQHVEGADEKLVPGHPSIAYLSQHFELAHSLRVEQVLEYANALDDDEATALYEICEIDHLLKRRTDQLSGGEAQRIAIARLLIGKPKLLLLDEPFSNLDMVHKNLLKIVIEAIGKKLKVTCIMISHDPEDTLPWADKILVMKKGEIIQKGSSEKIYKKPIDEYTAGLFGEYNILDQTLVDAFAKTQGIVLRKNAIIRPECFLLSSSKKPKSLKVEITNTNFFGSYYLVEVMAGSKAILIRTSLPGFLLGSIAYLSIDSNCI